MPRFNYVALDSRGQEASGVIEANSQSEAVGHLRQAGIFPKAIAEEGKGGKMAKAVKAATRQAASPKKPSNITLPFLERKTVKAKTLMIFTRQIATLIDAGLPLLRGLTVLAKQEPDPVLRKVIVSLAEGVQGGGTFSESLAGHPRIFSKLYVNMVKAGELGGVLELVLLRLAEFQEKAQKIKHKVVSAMFYPIIVLLIAILIFGFLLGSSAKFEAIFADMLGGETVAGPYPICHRGEQRGEEQYFGHRCSGSRPYHASPTCRTDGQGRFRPGHSKAEGASLRRSDSQERHFALQPHVGNAGHERRSDSSGAQYHPRNRGEYRCRRRHHESPRQRERR